MRLLTTRRRAIAGLSAIALAPACTLSPRGGGRQDAVFAHGVASGDPDSTSVVIWTRVNPSLGISSTGWQVSEDPGFSRTVAAGSVPVGPERDHTAKVVVESLVPGTTYYYRFTTATGESPVGRTRTLPAGRTEAIKFAIASCSNYPFGHFNAYDAISRDDDIAFVLHLGDYIYEYAADGWGGDIGETIGRAHWPLNEIVSLADYRARHAQYKSDVGSQRMHSAHPLIPIWDDHESTNNPWTGGAENHQPDTEGDWVTRRAASLRAYYEWMPIREPAPGADPARYWRHFRIGDLASLVTLETRHTGRSRQIEYAEHLSRLTSVEAARRFRDEVLGDPGRSMLAPAMSGFFAASMRDAVEQGRTWKLVGNQIPIGRVEVPEGTAEVIGNSVDLDDPVGEELRQLELLGRYSLPIYLDTWDGYEAARERFYQSAAMAGVEDLLVLTGDSHAFWLNELHRANGTHTGYEIGTAGISSPGDFERFGAGASVRLDQMMAEHNPEVLWTDNRHRGWVNIALSHDAAEISYMSVSSVEQEDYAIEEIRRTRIVHSGSRLMLA